MFHISIFQVFFGLLNLFLSLNNILDLPFDDPRDICYEYSANHVQQGSYLVTVVTGKNVGVSGLYKFYEQSDGDERYLFKDHLNDF